MAATFIDDGDGSWAEALSFPHSITIIDESSDQLPQLHRSHLSPTPVDANTGAPTHGTEALPQPIPGAVRFFAPFHSLPDAASDMARAKGMISEISR